MLIYKTTRQKIEEAEEVFRSKKILTIEELIEIFNSSKITARRQLRRWKAYTSYNYKGRYYTLPSIPHFNEYGIWTYMNISFTKHRNLKATIVFLLKDAQAGMTSDEIGKIVGLNPGSFMHHFRNIAGIRREKQGGRYIYYSAEPLVYEKQKHERELLIYDNRKQLVSDVQGVVILVQLIKNPDCTLAELTEKVKREKVKIEVSTVRKFLESHDLLKKKEDIKR